MAGIGPYDLRDEKQAKEYLEKIGIEYRFQVGLHFVLHFAKNSVDRSISTSRGSTAQFFFRNFIRLFTTPHSVWSKTCQTVVIDWVNTSRLSRKR